jgi:nucleoside-diphosphate-sugar epimerase
MRVVVSGAAGRLARVVLPSLCADGDIERVTGIDRVEPEFRHSKFEPVIADIGDPLAHAALRGADALVNLAFVLFRKRLPVVQMARTNVAATRTLLRAAADADVRSIVHMSSAAVYGQGVDVTEAAALAPLPRFQYAQHKAAVEAWMACELPHAAVLRPTIVLGKNAQPLLQQLAAMPFYVAMPDPQPRLQCIDEDDVAQAVALALRCRASGAFNLAAPSTFSVRELVRARRPHAPGVPLALARMALKLAWRTTGWGGEPGWLDGLTSSLTLDCRRARRVLGWRPRHEDWRRIVAAA